MVEQAKAWVEQVQQAKATVEGLRQQSQSQVKILEAISRVMEEVKQHRHEVVSGPARKLFDELRGNAPRIFVKLVNFITHM